MEHYLVRHFHYNFDIYLNQSQDTLASEGILSTLFLTKTTLLSPSVLEPRFLNVRTVTWECDFSVFVMTFLMDLMATIASVNIAVLSMTYIYILWNSS